MSSGSGDFLTPGSEIRDLGSGIKLFRIPDPGVKKAPDPGSGSATLDLYAYFSRIYSLITKELETLLRIFELLIYSGDCCSRKFFIFLDSVRTLSDLLWPFLK